MDLLTLVELSLGSQAHSGIVNFNYLHELLVQIVLRLNNEQLVAAAGGSRSRSIQQLLPAASSHPDAIVTSAVQAGLPVSSSHHVAQGPATSQQPSTSSSLQQQPSASFSHHDSHAVDPMTSQQQSAGQVGQQQSAGQVGQQQSASQVGQQQSAGQVGQQQSVGQVSQQQSAQSQHVGQASPPTRSKTEPELPGASEVSLPHTASTSTTPEHGLQRRGTSAMSHTRPSSIAGTVHDLSALERKLQALEARINTMESLGDLLERRASDKDSTPVKDMWNFTLLNNKIGSTEEGLEKTSRILDELLGEVGKLSKSMSGYDDRLAALRTAMEDNDKSTSSSLQESLKGLATLEERLNQLEALKMATSSDSPNEAFTAMVEALQKKFGSLHKFTDELKSQVDDMEGSMKDQLANLLAQQTSQLGELHQRMDGSDKVTDELSQRVNALATELSQVSDQCKQLQVDLALKVNVSDLTSLMPQSGSSEDASLMPMLVDIQSKMRQLEADVSKQPSLPADLLDKIAAMQNSIDQLSADISKLCSAKGASVDSNRVEELGSQLAQLRDRLEDIDRAVAALTGAVSAMQQQGPLEETTDSSNYGDVIAALQQAIANQQEGQDRILGTVANLSHEQEIDKEHIKALYSAVDELKTVKADKEQVSLEVEEKADRRALESKASREWVDSTFDRLDKEIREARSHLMGQEEAFKNAMSQINEDVEGKLDRMELEPLKEYFDKRLARVNTAPVCAQEPVGDDAAGFKKPMRFHCISCDKPLGLRSSDVVPSLPQIAVLPNNKSLRPYTTYELELIRRSQRLGIVTRGVLERYPSSIRAVGGVHTVTRPHQKVRVTPLSSPYNPDSTQPMARSAVSSPTPPRPNIYPRTADELDIIGQDGHIYKGRAPPRPLPPIAKTRQARVTSSRVGRRTNLSPPPHQ